MLILLTCPIGANALNVCSNRGWLGTPKKFISDICLAAFVLSISDISNKSNSSPVRFLRGLFVKFAQSLTVQNGVPLKKNTTVGGCLAESAFPTQSGLSWLSLLE